MNNTSIIRGKSESAELCSKNHSIQVRNLTKIYKLYAKPKDRLKEALHPFNKKYHKYFTALKDIDLDIQKGEILGILGKNGSGKSTLLKLISGILQPTSGSVKVNGSVAALLELGSGFNPEFTGMENIYFYGSIQGFTQEEMEEKIDYILDFADIGEFIHQPLKTYSTGMKMRLAFSAATCIDPDILILDEVLAVGDVQFQLKCFKRMEEIRESGTTILFVTHSPSSVKRFCTRSIWMHEGYLRLEGATEKVADTYTDFLYSSKSTNTEISREQKLDAVNRRLARIESVTIEKDSLSIFEALRIRMNYSVFSREVEDLMMGVAIFNRDGIYVFGANTFLDGVDTPNTIGNYTINYTIPKLSLLPGTYFVDVGLHSKNSLVRIDYKARVCNFVVNADYIAEGIVYLDHEWKIETENTKHGK